MSLENQNIEIMEDLVSPRMVKQKLPITKQIQELILKTREEVANIINHRSNRKLFIVGPCSIHSVEQAVEYGKFLKKLSDKVKDKILIVMRVYFEKPRTTIGWKGLINDPNLDDSCDVNKGLFLARKLLIDLNSMGLPCGYEVLDTITPQYISDLISWGAIGARTTESQVHRQLVSGLSMPVGFKNGTGGSIKIAADGILSAKYPHCFMGITDGGRATICKTLGNHNCHIILRGSTHGPNYEDKYLKSALHLLKDREIPKAIMVDCSHANSGKDHRNQKKVLRYTLERMKDNNSIIGVMIESNLKEGKQKLSKNLEYGVSITDSCIGIEETRELLLEVITYL